MDEVASLLPYRLLDANGKPAKGVYPANVQVFSPFGKRMKCFERFVPVVDGTLADEFTMPVNTEKGTWKITGTNKVTFEEISASFEVV
jgi:hypothetical protein